MELRESIIECAVELFSTNGLRFTMQDVAKRLHIAKKTIYGCFESKQALLCAMLDEGYARIQADKKAIMESDLELCEKIRKAMVAIPDQYSVLDFRMLAELNEKYPDVYERLVMHLENNWEPVIALLEQGIRQGEIRPVSIPLFRQMFTASIESFLNNDMLSKENLSWNQALEEMMDILMDGVRKRVNNENQ